MKNVHLTNNFPYRECDTYKEAKFMNLDGAKKIISITVCSEKEKIKVGQAIHNQLMGNQDYIDSNIILNIDEPYTVNLFIFPECSNVPKIVI